MANYDHIYIRKRTISLPYSAFGRGAFKKRLVQRETHGNRLKTELDNSVFTFSQGEEQFDFVYLEFVSAKNFELDILKFEDRPGNIRLASCKEIKVIEEDGSENKVYKAAVYLNKKAVAQFLEKIDKYLSEDTKTGNPRYDSLISNIDGIKAATIESFWQEPEVPLPIVNEQIWWEVWFSKFSNSELNIQDYLIDHLDEEIELGERSLEFPEHLVVLIKATTNQLSNNLLSIENLAEFRKPVEVAEFFTYLNLEWERKFIEDLLNRTTVNQSAVSVCLLDSGVNRMNALLQSLIPEHHLESINPAWTAADTYPGGHGTPMAGLIFYGDLVEALSGTSAINIEHHLESIKIIENNRPNDPELYGSITLEAVASAEVMNPDNKRIVCLAVTAQDCIHYGKPSSWSSSLDLLAFGSIENPNNKNLIFVSGGNIALEDRRNYPLINDDLSIQDPAQSFNSITVGAYTLKDKYDAERYQGVELFARRGGMSPCNSTSVNWERQWAKKPDIVMEGGNDGQWQGGIFDADSLKVLSTGLGGMAASSLTTFGDTSAANALASNFAAKLYNRYSHFWPETIRGLIIHSATWTTEMLGGRAIQDLSTEEQKLLISRVGYGVPNLDKASSSAENSLTMIAERILKPFRYDSRVQTNHFHLFTLPWPQEVLTELFDVEVTFTITLSYFIEPNPGNKLYGEASSYRSHGLRFKMIDSNESNQAFRARVSKTVREETENYQPEGRENWILGSEVRDKGSIHKDFWIGTAADLATRNKIAVYPIGGWWKTRKKLQRYDHSVRYSLVMNISTPRIEMDIYTPVLNQIAIEVEG